MKVGTQTLTTNSYHPGNGPVAYVQYGNGYIQNYEYDEKYQLTSVSGKESNEPEASVLYTNEYDHYGNVTKHTDQENNISYEYQHDLIGRVSGMKSSKDQRIGIKYDDKNRIHIWICGQFCKRTSRTHVWNESRWNEKSNIRI